MNKNLNNLLNDYIKHKKEDKNRFSQLDKALKQKAQSHYLDELRKEKLIHDAKKQAENNKLITIKSLAKDYLEKAKHHIQQIKEKIKDILSIKNSTSSKKERINVFSFFKLSHKNLNKKIPIFAGIAVLVISLGIFSKMMIEDMTAYKVYFNGEEIGIVKNKDTVFHLVDIIEDKLDIAYSADIIIHKDNIKFEQVKEFGIEVTPDDELLSYFTYFQNLEAKSYCLYIEGEPLVNFSSKKEIEQLLEDVQEVYIDSDNDHIKYEEVSFLENIDVREEETVLASLNNFDYMLDYILKGTTEERKHKVKKGENYWTIAEKYNITPEELEAANPKVKPERLQIGQEISLIVPKPLLTVVTKEKVTYSEKIPYEITYENTAALYKGENNIKLRGKKGEKEILAEVERHNGIEVTREEIESKTIKEPVTQVVLVGTKDPPPLIGTGSFDNPARGRLTSKFGYRWGRMHTGIDIAASIGTTIRASDGGVVTFAGWKGNYGLTVIIDHGQNKSTLYGHCNKVHVKKGDKVYKGQKIADVGNTGRSTGPHVHFEVRVSDKPQNPLNYVSY
ncbi:MAG: M23 family metallopeptidase [Clostridia bacterium]|nr:M23 family metallopeptidase [Clostridia bacterium]